MLKKFNGGGGGSSSGKVATKKEENHAPTTGILSSHNQRTNVKEETKPIIAHGKIENKSPQTGADQSESTTSTATNSSEKPAGKID